MKRLLLLVLALLMAAALCSCDLIGMIERLLPTQDSAIDTEHNLYLKVKPGELTYNEGYTPVTGEYGYQALPLEGERVLYRELLQACYSFSPLQSESVEGRYEMPQVKIDGYSLTEAQVRTVIRAVTDDRPEIFWIAGTIGYFSDEDTTVLQTYSKFSPEEVNARLDAVHREASAFYASVPDGLSEYERERAVHDYIIAHTEYEAGVDTVNIENNDPDIYTVYGALVNGVAVCEGYAKAFQLLLNGLGVDCVGITGSSRDELHMWNEVKLGENWYGVDVTWDDQEEIYYRYANFNLTTDQLNENHSPSLLFTQLSDDEINGEADDGVNSDIMNLFVPDCTDPTMSYFYRETAHLDDYDGTDVKNALYAAADQEEAYFIFYLDEDLDFSEAIDLLFISSPQYFFSYIRSVNGYLSSYSIDESNVGFFSMPMLRIFIVELSYY